jgi:RNA polymerase sigma-70 factor (ECF subfamily)
MKLLSRGEIIMIEGMKHRDERSFDMFYKTKYNFLYFVILKILKNKQDTEEVVQDTFIKIYEKIESFSGNNFNSWIYTIAKNKALNFYNRVLKKRKHVVNDSELVNNQIAADYSISPLYTKLLQHFSEETTDIIIYHAVHGFSFQHIAELLNVSKSYVFRNYKSSLSKLRLIVEEKI